jgi:5'-nucleotidase
VQAGKRAAIDGCEGGLAGTPIARIVARFDDAVDLVVSGHTHAAYNCRLPNAAGRRVPVTSASAFGRVLTDIDLAIDPATRDVVGVRAANRLVVRDDPAVPPDASVARFVARYEGHAAPLASQVIGSIAATVSNARVDAACNMPAGELIADAMLEATRAEADGGAAIAFMNPGGVRSPGFEHRASAGEGDGNVTYGEAFTVQPFGNSLVTLTLSARELRAALEEQFAGCRGQPATTTRVMLPSAGLRYEWDGTRPCDARIRRLTLTTAKGSETVVEDGAIVGEPSPPFRVTVNSYMAEGGDGYSTFRGAAARTGGPQDIDALVAYMRRFKAPNAPYLPGSRPEDGGGPRITRAGGTSCPTAADVNP